MASKVFNIKNAAAPGSSHGSLQDGGSVTDATTGTGWIVSKTAAGRYALIAFGSELAASVFNTTALPNAAPSTTDCFRSESAISGSFASGNWTVSIPVIAVTGGAAQDGRMRVRVWQGAAADGSDAVEMTSAATQLSIVTNLTTGAQQISSGSVSVTANLVLSAAYVFLQCAWEITGAGGTNGHDVNLRVDSTDSKVTTTEFTPAALTFAGSCSAVAAVSGSLAVTRGVSTSCAASSSLSGALAVEAAGGEVLFAGTIAASAVASGTLAASRAFSGGVGGGAAMVGALARSRRLAASVVATSAVAPAGLAVARSLQGSASAAVGAAGAVRVARPLSGSVAGTAGASAALTVAGASVVTFAGTVAAACAVSGSLAVRRALGCSAGASSSLSGTLAGRRALAGAVSAAGALSASLTVDGASAVALAGTVSATSIASGALAVGRSLGCSAGATSALSAALTVEAGDTTLAGSLACTVTCAGSLSMLRPLAAAVSSSSAIAGHLASGETNFAGRLEALSYMVGRLRVRLGGRPASRPTVSVVLEG